MSAPNVGPFGDPAVLVGLAIAAEEAGWDGFFVWDHVLYHRPDWPVVDPWVVISAIAARTSSIRIGVLMAAVPRYRPWQLAKTAATIDRLSGGRLIFGAAIGSMDREYSAFGDDPAVASRAAGLDEGLEVIDGLWRGRPVDHDGARWRVEVDGMLPVPVQSPRIPVWLGGRWPNRRPFLRAARWDGVMPTHADHPHGTTIPPSMVAEVAAFVGASRQAPGPFDVAVEGESPTDPRAAADVVGPYSEAGATWWVEKLGWWRGDTTAALARVTAGPPPL